MIKDLRSSWKALENRRGWKALENGRRSGSCSVVGRVLAVCVVMLRLPGELSVTECSSFCVWKWLAIAQEAAQAPVCGSVEAIAQEAAQAQAQAQSAVEVGRRS